MKSNPMNPGPGWIGASDSARKERLMTICNVVRGIGPSRAELRYPSYQDQEPALQRAVTLPVDGPQTTLLPLGAELAQFSKVLKAGASVVVSERFETLAIPSVNRSLRATFADNSPDVGGDPLDAALPQPRRISGFVTVSDRLKLQNELLVGSFVERQLLSAVAAGIDHAALSGTGTGEPLGVLNDDDIPTHERATANVTSYDDLCAMEEAIAAGHGENAPEDYAWLVSPDVREQFRNTPIVSGGDRMILDPAAGTPGAGGGVLGYPAVVLPDAPAGTVVLAQVPQLALIDWQRLELESLQTVSEAKTGMHTLLVTGYLDTVTLDPNAFCVAVNPS